MKKIIFLLVFMTTVVAAAHASVAEVAKRIAPSVVEIYVQPTNSTKFLSAGTGWLYGSQGLVVTADHVIQEKIKSENTKKSPDVIKSKPYARIKVRFSDNELVDVVSSKSSANVDLAILTLNTTQLKNKKRPLLEIASFDPVIGDVVMGMGYPFDYPNPVLFVGYVNQEMKPLCIGMTATVCPGHSGSAVVNDQGEVVGIVLWIDERSSSLNFFLPRSTLVKELKALMAR